MNAFVKGETCVPWWFEYYQQALHQEVYDKLLAMQENIAELAVYEEALRTMRTLMRRMRQNSEVLVSRLQMLGYRFGEGFAASPEEPAYWERAAPMYQPPTPETPEHVARLEERVGPLPLALRCW